MILKILNRFVTDFYKIEIFRTCISFLRFFVLFKILRRNFKFKNKIEITDDHIELHRDNKILSVDDHNLHYSENLFDIKKTYNQFSGGKTKLITMPLGSIDYLDFDNSKVLSVGPRNEGELYFIRSLGFKWKNISSIDLLSYSSKIKLGDIHDTDYQDNYFDVIVCGWVIPYSNNYKKILDEIYRITNNKGILCVGYTYIPEEQDKIRKYKKNENRFNSNQQIIEHYGEKIKNVYFNFDAYADNKDHKRQSIFVCRINK